MAGDGSQDKLDSTPGMSPELQPEGNDQYLFQWSVTPTFETYRYDLKQLCILTIFLGMSQNKY